MFVRDLRCVALGSECVSTIWHGITRSLANWFRSWNIWSQIFDLAPIVFYVFYGSTKPGKPPWFTMIIGANCKTTLAQVIEKPPYGFQNPWHHRSLTSQVFWKQMKTGLWSVASHLWKSSLAHEPSSRSSRRMGGDSDRESLFCCGNNPLTSRWPMGHWGCWQTWLTLQNQLRWFSS